MAGFLFAGPPDLAVEVLSPNDRASEVAAKVQDWLRAGGPMVWVVDRELRNVMVYRGPNEITLLSVADVLTGGDVLPGLSVPVGDLFA
jgi:Uma2 family endonuclease